MQTISTIKLGFGKSQAHSLVGPASLGINTSVLNLLKTKSKYEFKIVAPCIMEAKRLRTFCWSHMSHHFVVYLQLCLF